MEDIRVDMGCDTRPVTAEHQPTPLDMGMVEGPRGQRTPLDIIRSTIHPDQRDPIVSFSIGVGVKVRIKVRVRVRSLSQLNT